MKNFIKNRYHLHLAAGAITVIVLWLVAFLSKGVATITNIADLEIVLTSLRWCEGGILGATLATIAGLFWEMYHYFKGSVFDKWDVVFTAIGGLIMGILIL